MSKKLGKSEAESMLRIAIRSFGRPHTTFTAELTVLALDVQNVHHSALSDPPGELACFCTQAADTVTNGLVGAHSILTGHGGKFECVLCFGEKDEISTSCKICCWKDQEVTFVLGWSQFQKKRTPLACKTNSPASS